MLACSTGACGVGGWGGPLPGDPSNDSILSATPAFGGIDVNWNYPTTNPAALAYTKLYRGTTDSFNTAILIKEVAGSFWYDKLETSARYYYWIRFVSVNGTVGDLIGPASAVAKPLIAGMIELLTGQIDNGVLATALRTKIDRIGILEVNLAGEVKSREDGETTLSQAIADAQKGVAQALTFLANERTSRIEGQNAFADALDLVAVTSGKSIAAVQTTAHAEVTVVGDRVTALSERLTQVVTQQGKDLAQVNDDLKSQIQTNASGIKINADAIRQTAVTAGDNLSAAQTQLRSEINTVGDRVSQLASKVDTVESSAGKNLAQVEVRMTTNINTVGDKVTAIGALYTAQVSVNGLIGGFGVYNDGRIVEAGFDVDRFWVGRTGANKRKPFIIEGDTVYIDEAAINRLTFSKLRDEAGSFVVSNGKVRASLLDTNGLVIRDLAGNPMFGAGVNLDGSLVIPPSTWLNSQVTLNANGTLNGAGGGQVTYTGIGGKRLGTIDQIVADNVSTYIAGAAIGTAQIALLAVKTGQIDNLAVTSAKIANLAVDTLQIAGEAVIVPRSAYGASALQGVTLLSVVLPVTEYGQTVLISFTGTAYPTYDSEDCGVTLYRDGTPLSTVTLNSGALFGQGTNPCVSLTYRDVLNAGTYTYRVLPNSQTTRHSNRSLVVFGVKR